MKLPLIFFLFWLMSCKEEEIVFPTCDFVNVTQYEDRLKLVIHSEDNSTTICREFASRTQCWTILENFYNCISLSYTPGETFYVHGIDGICTFQAQ
jgi:hypothetical protein